MQPGTDRWLVHDSVVDPFEMPVPPAQALLKKSDARSRQGEMRIFMRPGTNKGFFRTREVFHHAKDRIGITIGPATDRIDRHLALRDEPVVHRDDDHEEAVRKRLDAYKEWTAPVASFYEDRGLLRRIDGVGDPGGVYERLQAVLA